MSSLGVVSSTSNTQLQLNEPMVLDENKKYYLYYTPTSITDSCTIILTERYTAKKFELPLQGYIKVKGKRIASITPTAIGNGTLNIVEKDVVEIANAMVGNVSTLLSNVFATLYNKIASLSYVQIGNNGSTVLLTNNLPIGILTSQSNFTTSYTLLLSFNMFSGILTMFFSTMGAASGETDTLIITDQFGNTVYTANITNVQNQKIQLWSFTDNQNGQGGVSIIASGTASPSGKISFKIVQGAV